MLRYRNQFSKLFHPLIEVFQERMIGLEDTGFHAKAGDPTNLKCCRQGTWNARMALEIVFSVLTGISYLKRVMPWVADYFQARLAFMVVAFKLLGQWDGLTPDENGFVPLSIAEFSL